MQRASLGAAMGLLAFAGVAAAQPYPSRPVTLIVPFGAGGPVDTLARALSEAMRVSLGQPVVIENVTGASGTIGVGRAVRAAPDGYTVSIGNWPSHVVNGAIYSLPYDVLKDFEPVARLPSNPYVIVGKKGPAGQGPQGADRLAQGQPGQGDARHRRARRRPAHQRRLFPERHRHALPVRALSRRLLRDHARPGGRPHRSDLRPGHHRAAACAQRHGQGLCRDLRHPPRRRAGYPDGRRGRRARRLHLDLVRACGCPRARRRRSSASSRPRPWMRSPIRRCGRGSPVSGRRFRRASSRPRRRLPPTTRPRSRNGGR